jgi:hypothetical protein
VPVTIDRQWPRSRPFISPPQAVMSGVHDVVVAGGLQTMTQI